MGLKYIESLETTTSDQDQSTEARPTGRHQSFTKKATVHQQHWWFKAKQQNWYHQQLYNKIKSISIRWLASYGSGNSFRNYVASRRHHHCHRLRDAQTTQTPWGETRGDECRRESSLWSLLTYRDIWETIQHKWGCWFQWLLRVINYFIYHKWHKIFWE